MSSTPVSLTDLDHQGSNNSVRVFGDENIYKKDAKFKDIQKYAGATKLAAGNSYYLMVCSPYEKDVTSALHKGSPREWVMERTRNLDSRVKYGCSQVSLVVGTVSTTTVKKAGCFSCKDKTFEGLYADVFTNGVGNEWYYKVSPWRVSDGQP